MPAANEAMHRAVRNAGRPGLIAGVLSAVDIALWDLKVRLVGLPLARLLGACRPEVPVYGSGGLPPIRRGSKIANYATGPRNWAFTGSRSRSERTGPKTSPATANA
ncbi:MULTISPECIES: hypothetical protein [unclassified Streptomyces]|uniref:hypothetical protein n=1 Tax=unclassified Streptomyces TaxID=2593676 RepID=UPI002DDB6AAC|nr:MULTISPECIES: hypothetical protein [unclassified Streptomyces]